MDMIGSIFLLKVFLFNYNINKITIKNWNQLNYRK